MNDISNSDVSIEDTERWARECSERVADMRGYDIERYWICVNFCANMFPKIGQHL